MATEAVKLVIGIGEPLVGRLMLFDSLRMHFKEVRIRRNPDCVLCGDHPSVTELIDYEAFCDVQLPGLEPEAPAAGNGAGTADANGLELQPQQLKSVLDSGRKLTLLDVREPHEWDINRIEGARLTPLSKFEEYIPELNPEDEIYLYCYKGKRSMTALKKLEEKGFKHLKSLAGGIDAWAVDVEPGMPRY